MRVASKGYMRRRCSLRWRAFDAPQTCHMMPLHVCVKERLADVQRSCPQVFPMPRDKGGNNMGSMHHGMLLVVSEPTLPGRFDH